MSLTRPQGLRIGAQLPGARRSCPLGILTGASCACLGHGYAVAGVYLKAAKSGLRADAVMAKAALLWLHPETQKAIQAV